MATKNVHAGHRENVRQRFKRDNDFQNWQEHEVLEFLLFYALPRIDTNVIAHNLINECGGFGGVFTASESQLKSVEGVGDKVCDFIKTLSSFANYYNVHNLSKSTMLDSKVSIGYFRNLFYGKKTECLYMICLDVRGRIINKKLLSEGGFESTDVNIINIIRTAAACNAANVILAHNHPSGELAPSNPDIIVTRAVEKALKQIGVNLTEHVIATDEGCMGIKEMKSLGNKRKIYKF